jgi:hypothetical protein
MFYLLKRQDEKQFSIDDRVMVLADFSGIPAGTKGMITEIYEEGVMVQWEMDGQRRPADGFSREELEYLAVETKKHPKLL